MAEDLSKKKASDVHVSKTANSGNFTKVAINDKKFMKEVSKDLLIGKETTKLSNLLKKAK